MTAKGLLFAAVLVCAASGAYASDAVLSDSELAGVFAGQNNEHGLTALVGGIDAEYAAVGEQINVAAVIGEYALENTSISNTNSANIENYLSDSVFLNQLNIGVVADLHEVDGIENNSLTHQHVITNSNEADVENGLDLVSCGFEKEESQVSVDGSVIGRGPISGEKSSIVLQQNVGVVYTGAFSDSQINNQNQLNIFQSGIGVFPE